MINLFFAFVAGMFFNLFLEEILNDHVDQKESLLMGFFFILSTFLALVI